MASATRFFASRLGIVVVGAIIGIVAPLLQKLGNPGNIGICLVLGLPCAKSTSDNMNAKGRSPMLTEGPARPLMPVASLAPSL